MIILAFSKGAEKIFGYARQDIVGQSIEKLIPHKSRDKHHGHVKGFLGGQSDSVQMSTQTGISGLRSDGTEIPIEAVITKNSKEGKSLICVIVRDVSAQIELQRVLRKARDEAEQATRAKSNFLATMSHEIRTPLHGVLGTLQLLKRGLDSDQQLQLIRTAEDAGLLLRGVIDDILDLSRVEAGHLVLEPEDVELESLIDSAVEGFRLSASNKGLAFTVSIDDQCPTSLHVDPLRLKQILGNLIGNAVKFTEAGSVDVQVTLVESDFLQLAVSDTGIGIEQDNLFDIFEQFSQSDGSIQRKFGGSGLGLSIVRELVSLMGGQCWVESWLGRGSKFWITIPVGASGAGGDTKFQGLGSRIDKTSAVPGENIGAGKVALVVDDTQTNQHICSEMLKEMGFVVRVCESGAEALKILKRETVDLVLLDMHMPLMSGEECLGRLRAETKKGGRIPVVMISADVGNEAKRRALLAGANAFCPKPFDFTLLVSTIFDCLARTESHIILIDDDPDEWELLNDMFGDLPQAVQFEHYHSADDFCRNAKVTRSTCVLLDGKIPPATCHEDSLKIIAEHGCPARFYLISAGKFTSIPKVEGLNVVAAIDKCDFLTIEQLGLFVDSLRAR